MRKLISLRNAHLNQIANSWEKIHSIYYWGMAYPRPLGLNKALLDFKKDAVRMRKLYQINISEIKQLGLIKKYQLEQGKIL